MPRDYRVYLDDIIDAINQIELYVEGMDYDAFVKDRKTIDAVIRNLEIVGEAVKNLPDESKEKAKTIPWKKIVDLRNILIHAYFGVNLEIVWDVVENKLEDLKMAVKEMLE
jgi:uncharacterized protein with HEPN domain